MFHMYVECGHGGGPLWHSFFCVPFCSASRLESSSRQIMFIFSKKLRCVCVNIKCGDKDTFSDLCLSGVRASLADDLAIFVSKLSSGSGVNDAF